MSGWDAPLPAGWSLVYSRSQARHYYFCKATGATQWEAPPAPPPSSSEAGGPAKRARTEEGGASSSAGDAFDDGEAGDGTAELGAGGVGMAGVERLLAASESARPSSAPLAPPSIIKAHPESEVTKWLREDLVVNATLRDIFTSERCLDRRGAAHKFIDGVDPIEGKHLYNCVRENGLARTLEVGCAMGTSALYFCQAFADGRGGAHVAIDPNQDTQYKSIARANVERAGLAAHFRVLREPSYLAMPRLLARGARFDLVFVDGWHTFDFTLLDMFYAERLLVPNGLLLLDDIQHKGVQKTLKYVRTNYCHEGGSLELIEDTPAATTMATFRKIKDDTRTWDFHKNF